MKSRCVLIAAGGTGGHVFPGIAVAHALKRAGIKVVWIGSQGGMEQQWIEKEAIPLTLINVQGLRGKSLLKRGAAFFNLFSAFFQAVSALKNIRPDAVLCMGGFVSGPAGLAAKYLAIPLAIHEQNAISGMTNRVLSYIAHKVFIAFPKTKGLNLTEKVIFTGNPVREAIMNLPLPSFRFKGRKAVLTILVLGGSRGAQALNESVPIVLSRMSCHLSVIHQCGAQADIPSIKAAYKGSHLLVDVTPFIDDMAAAYARADLVICRAGALTLSELMSAGLGAVLVPYPHAVDDHQTHNAAILVDAKAGIIWQQHESIDLLSEKLKPLLNRDELLAMAERARKLANPKTVQIVTETLMEIMNDCRH